MRLRPRHPTGLPVAEEDVEVLRRWGLARCHAVDVGVYWAGLSRLLPDETPPPTELNHLIGYIRRRFHRSHQELLEDAVALANAAEAAHAHDDAWPHGLADLLLMLLEDIEIHQQREDAVVFPLLLRPADDTSRARVAAMREEHMDISRRLDELRRMTTAFTAPPQACVAWRLLYVLCGKLDLDMRDQIALENGALFDSELRVFPEESGCSSTTLRGGVDPKTRPWRT